MEKYCVFCMAQIEDADNPCPVCGKISSMSVPAHHLMPGTMLNNKFYVGTALGEGGFGITYIGRDTKLDMKVAIKEFYPNGYVNRSNTISPRVNDSVSEDRKEFFEKGRERFLKEARILAKFSGEPGIVDVRDFFEENNTAYIIMEYLDGVDLKDYLKQKGTLTPDQTIRLLMPVMMSLKKVHAQGLIHRDISPDNIMLVEDKVKLLDFGAARNVSAAANKSLSVMLKPGYAPEEQYRSKGNQGPWTDVYALCATMYKCITGVTPDDATQRVFSDEVKAPSALGIEISEEIESAIMRGMSVQQKDRYQSIDDLLRGLQGIAVETTGANQTIAAVPNRKVDTEEPQYISSEKKASPINSVSRNSDEEETQYLEVDDSEMEAKKLLQKEEKGEIDMRNEESKTGKKTSGVVIGLMVGMAVVVIGLLLLLIIMLGKEENQGEEHPTPTVKVEEPTTAPVADEEDGITPDTDDSKEKEDSESKDDGEDNTEDKEDSTVKSDPEDSNGSDEDEEKDKVEDKDNEDKEEPKEEEPVDDKPAQIEMSDKLFDFTFSLDGVVYQLPCSYQTFTDNGWTISSNGYSSKTMIGGKKYDSFYMSKDGHKVMVYVYNYSGNAKKIEDCKIGGVMCEPSYGSEFVIAKEVTPLSGVELVKEAFGIPNSSNSGNSYESISYYNNINTNRIRFYFNLDNNEYSSIEMRNFVETEDDVTETNEEMPEYLLSYVEPSELGEDMLSSVVYLEGDLYQLPAPVSCFIENGWKIIEHSGSVEAGGTSSVRMKKNGKRMHVYIVNYGEYQTIPENCAVYKIDAHDDEKINIELPGTDKLITIGMAKDELDEVLGDEFSYYEGTYSYSYSYSEYRDREYALYIYVDAETKLVSQISLSCKTWNYE